MPWSESDELRAVRGRSVLFTKYVFWALSCAFVLLIGNAYFSLVQRWLVLLETARQLLGIPHAPLGPDWLLCTGFGIAIALPVAIIGILYWRYRKHWENRLRDIWQTGIPAHAKLHRLRSAAGEGELQRRVEYLGALRGTPGWAAAAMPDSGGSAETYKLAAEAVLRELEKDISQRAITLGLVVGVSRNRVVDLFMIAAAALELQLQILTRLGKRPSWATWRQMLTRTASSLFANSYLNADESLGLRIAIKKMGMGLEVASDLIDHAATSIGDHLENVLGQHDHPLSDSDDVDFDDLDHLSPEILGIMRPVFELLRQGTGVLVGVGTFGIRQLGVFIDKTGDELFEGAVAGGVLYYHGIAVAADCLALDRVHRESANMNRTLGQCMAVSSAAAGVVLLEGARTLRKALREKRRRALTLARDEIGKRASSVARSVERAAEKSGELLQTAVRDTGAAISTASEHAKNLSGDIWDGAKTTAEKASNLTSQTASTVRDSVTGAAGAVGNASQKLWQRTKKKRT
ncbi:MAG TPA: hypothetical protein VNY05_07395 [Candidatus Acidoferrales bacterium]|jgi:hypothetical protein|nr:hypothetical protein [Candidatus Acidoferrales bacterium]